MEYILISGTFLQLITAVSGLLCYNCENEPNNFLCVGEYNLRPCESGFDTCQTIVSYSDVSETLSIIKTCTKNSSCQLQIKEHEESVPCDKTGSEWICTTCCNDDGCNLNTATLHTSIYMYLHVIIFYFIKIIL